MCGIVGYIGNNAAEEVLLSGLKNLEYRGYDSAGVALNDNGRLNVYRAKGKLDNLYRVLEEEKAGSSRASLGIGHIRWATHGAATAENAHPHKSNDGRLVLVHNGIIENYKELREELMAEGFRFYSQTDTETAVHLVDREYKKCGSLEKAAVKAVALLKGAFAFCIMHQDEPDKIIAVRKNAPLIIGLGKNENYIASDIPAIIGKAGEIIYLDDDELAIVGREQVTVKRFDGTVLNKLREPLPFEQEAISKRGYKHFMLKEINEQPDIIRNMLALRLKNAADSIHFENPEIDSLLKNAGKIDIIACGTSLHAAMSARLVIEELTGVAVSVEAASEYIYKKNLADDKTLTIGISQSGETADTITALKLAKAQKSKILVITNRTDSSIVRYADGVLPLNAGIEVSVAATKSYTAQLASLYLLALRLAEMRQSLPAEKLQNLKEELWKIPAKMEQILSSAEDIRRCAEKYSCYRSFIYMARGNNLPSAYEGALKLKEISYINACGYAAGELKHGPIALLDETMPVLAILMPGSVIFEKMVSNCEEVKARHAKLIGVTSSDVLCGSLFDDVIKIPPVAEILSPILVNIPLQLLAYYIADRLGREVDQPRNLAKSVTVE